MNLNLQELVQQQLGGGGLQQLSQQIGADPETTSNAISTALPMLLGGMARNTQSPEGASSLLAALDRDHDGSVLDDVVGFLGGGGASSVGSGILGHIFGDRRETVEAGISQASGLDLSQVAQLLPLLAPIVMGALGRTQRQQGLDSGSLAGLLGQESQQAASSSPVLGTLSQLLDANRDGSVIDDVAGMLGGLLGGRRS